MIESNIQNSIAEVATELKSRYEKPGAALVPLLFEVQAQNGFVSDESEVEVAQLLELSQREVHEVVTFYPLLWQEAKGQFHIQFCHNISC